MSAAERERPAVRLVAAATQAGEQTEQLWLRATPPVRYGCRSRVNGVRCSHPRDQHYQVGFYEGERVHCSSCACAAWRAPWLHVARDVASWVLLVVGLLAFVVFFWDVVFPALIEALT